MITALTLQNFRSYTNDSFEFNPGVNIIIGPNASGKTNLLEAVLLTCVGKSYRAKDAELVLHNAPWTRLQAATEHSSRVVKLQKTDMLLQKTFTINDVTYKRLSLQKSIPAVLFEPNHLILLSGSPEGRREYLDELLEQITPGFSTLRRQYKRTLTQRNALLKNEDIKNDQLFAWNIRLSQLGGQIVIARQTIIDYFQNELPDLYQQLSNQKDVIVVEYMSGCVVEQYSSDMLHKLEQSTTIDIQRGFTSYGPHRDDLKISMNGYPMYETASRGETRTTLLAIKILELKLLEKEREQKPLLLLDDVFSELDGSRRRALTQYLNQYQTFITTTDADIVAAQFKGATVIPLQWQNEDR